MHLDLGFAIIQAELGMLSDSAKYVSWWQSVEVQALVGWVWVRGWEALKSSPQVRFISQESTIISRVASGLVAFFLALGLTFDWTGSMVAGGVLQISIPGLPVLVKGLFGWWMNEMNYDLMRRTRSSQAEVAKAEG